MQDARVVETNPKDRGFNLPIGVFNGGGLKRDFTLREMGYPIEKAIGIFKGRNDTLPNTAVVSKVVSLVVSKLGGETLDFKPDDDEQREADAMIKIGGLFLADVYYIYVMARIEELGVDYEVDFACSDCSFTGKMIVDLNTMKVNTVQDTSVLRREVPLVKGIKHRTGLKKSVFIQPMIWANMVTNEVKEAGGDPGLMKLHFIRHCVIGVEGESESAPLTDEEMSSLRKIDIEIIGRAISEVNIGPSLIAKGDCPNPDCKTPFLARIDWDYDNFFTISSP